MRKRLVMLLLLLVGGAIVNVAVAWGLVLVQSRTLPLSTMRHDIWPLVPYLKYNGPGAATLQQPTWIIPHNDEHRIIEFSERLHWHQRFLQERVTEHDNPLQAIEHRLEAGWPRIALRTSWCQRTESVSVHLTNNEWLSQLIQRLRWPIWPGFAINTVFYAVMLWVLFAAPFALRRWRRIRRGLCPACAHPVGDNPVCTECGKTVERARVMTRLD